MLEATLGVIFFSAIVLLLALHGSDPQARSQETPDYTSLAQPSYANRLSLTDQQRVEIAEILDQQLPDSAGEDSRVAGLRPTFKSIQAN